MSVKCRHALWCVRLRVKAGWLYIRHAATNISISAISSSIRRSSPTPLVQVRLVFNMISPTSQPNVIDRVEVASGPIGVRHLATLEANVARITVLEFNSAMTLDMFRSPRLQRILASAFPQLEKLTLIVNHSVTATSPYTGMPMFRFDPARFPRLTDLRLDGVALGGQSLSTLRSLELRNFPGREPSEQLPWYPFMALINTATSLHTLRLDQYMHSVHFDTKTLAMDGFYTIHGSPRARFYLPNLTELVLRDNPIATAHVCAYLGPDCTPATIHITGLVGDNALLDPNGTYYMFSRLVTNGAASDPSALFRRTVGAVLSFEANAFVLFCRGPENVQLALRVERAAPSLQLNTSQIEAAQRSALCSAAWFIATSPVVTFACHETPESLGADDWDYVLTALTVLRQCVIAPQTGARAQTVVVSFLEALHTPRFDARGWGRRILRMLAVKGARYTPELLQGIEEVLRRHQLEGAPARRPEGGPADREVECRSVSVGNLELSLAGMSGYVAQDMELKKRWEKRLAPFVGTAKIIG
ncbi:hypothetical protein C8Q80DRAFT_1354187 [Daedaleopsis nitida]|nr:hypothetical protein C8Q80DRAFT_1354187 [Daedaleopsis nitida]